MQLTNINTIKDLFERHGFGFTKTLGQNFLINPSVCPRIAEMGGSGNGVGAIEVGTGVGVLTAELAQRCDKVVAIEIDKGLKSILDETLADFDNVEVIFADVLETDIGKIISEKFQGLDVIVCANLPYYITSPVIMKLLEEKLPIKSITVMVQKEAADRICAQIGTRESGAISIAVNYYSKPEILFKVSRGSFMPAPNVDSAVIRLNIHQSPLFEIEDEKLFFRIVRCSFAQRRKQIINPLSSEFHIEKRELSDLMNKGGISPLLRPEQLKMQDFETLYNIMYNATVKK